MRAGAAASTSRGIPGAIGVAIGVALAAVQLAAQAPASSIPPPGDLLSELALRVTASLSPETVASLDPSTDEQVRREFTDRLAARGVQVAAPADGRPRLRVGCAANLRELTCSAEISGPSPRVIVVAQPRTAEAPPASDGVLELRPLVSLDEPILDVARNGDRLLVLTPSAVIKFGDDDGRWRRQESRPLPAARVWPRDVRGRFRLTGDRFEAFLPAMTCAGDAGRLTMTCAESAEPWPVPLSGARLEPTRNFFRLPDGTTAYGMASLGADAGARWLLARTDGALVLVDEAGQRTATTAAGDDVVAVRAGCAPSSVVVSARAVDRSGDQLTMYSVARRRLLPTGTPVRLSGRTTALWPADGGDGATVVTYDPDARRYDAHHLSVACPR